MTTLPHCNAHLQATMNHLSAVAKSSAPSYNGPLFKRCETALEQDRLKIFLATHKLNRKSGKWENGDSQFTN